MPRGKTAGGDAAREKIRSEAEALFAAQGFHGTSIRDLARAAGMATASMLHHYPSKAKLYGAVLATIAEDLEARLTAPLVRPDPAPSRLMQLADALLDWVRENPDRGTLLLRELLDNPARLSKATRYPLLPLLDRVSGFIREAQEDGDLRAVDPDLFLVHIAGAMLLFQVSRPTLSKVVPSRSPAELGRAHREAVRTFVARVARADG